MMSMERRLKQKLLVGDDELQRCELGFKLNPCRPGTHAHSLNRSMLGPSLYGPPPQPNITITILPPSPPPACIHVSLHPKWVISQSSMMMMMMMMKMMMMMMPHPTPPGPTLPYQATSGLPSFPSFLTALHLVIMHAGLIRMQPKQAAGKKHTRLVTSIHHMYGQPPLPHLLPPYMLTYNHPANPPLLSSPLLYTLLCLPVSSFECTIDHQGLHWKTRAIYDVCHFDVSGR
jgi:hypothetical protein